MIPVRADRLKQVVPVVTWTLVLLNVIIYVWDRRGGSFLGPNVVFADLTMRPAAVMQVVDGVSKDNFALLTIFTSMFMHASLAHLLGNLVFLVVFGGGVEDAIGSLRFTIYYLAWGVVAALTQIYVTPDSMIPTLGASGAIGGVLGAYLLIFPSSKIEIYVPFLFQSFDVNAWILLGLWFLFQILLPQEGVANWAHAGGFLAGMLTVLVVGGRSAILATARDD